MPLQTNPLSLATPPTPAPIPSLTLPTATWVDPAGQVWELTNTSLPYFTMAGPTGIGVVPVTITADDQPRGGTTVRNIQPTPRVITWPLYVEGRTHPEFLAQWRALCRAFSRTRRDGPGQLVIARPDGSARQIDAYYQDGLDVSTDGGITWEVVAINLYCPSPFWRGLEPLLVSHSAYGSGPSFLSPFPTVTSARTLGRTIVDNLGTVEAWPTWTINGPASLITAINHTLGKTWVLDPVAFRGAALSSVEQVVITTDPATVTGPPVGGDTGWAGALNWPGAQLWELAEGPNDIEYIVLGSNSSTTVDVTYVPRFETA